MLRKQTQLQSAMEVVLIENLVPQDHLLRKIDAILDSEHIRNRMAEFYSERGRPALDL